MILLEQSQNTQRLVTAFLLGSIFFGCFAMGPAFLYGLFGLAYLLCLGEWRGMVTSSPKGLWLLSGFFYISCGFLGVFYLIPHKLLCVLMVIWANDSGAYFIGRMIKGPKLAPRISPGKTWSGCMGGLITGMLTGFLWCYYHDSPFTYLHGIGFFMIIVLAVMGDLLESHVKRHFGVKDSSQLLPGHGGVLDRLDSLLAVGIGFLLIRLLGLEF